MGIFVPTFFPPAHCKWAYSGFAQLTSLQRAQAIHSGSARICFCVSYCLTASAAEEAACLHSCSLLLSLNGGSE